MLDDAVRRVLGRLEREDADERARGLPQKDFISDFRPSRTAAGRPR